MLQPLEKSVVDDHPHSSNNKSGEHATLACEDTLSETILQSCSSQKKLSTPEKSFPTLQSTPSTRSMKRRNLLTPRKMKFKKRADFLSLSKSKATKRYQTEIKRLKSTVARNSRKIKTLEQRIKKNQKTIEKKNAEIQELKLKLSNNTSSAEHSLQAVQLKNLKRRLARSERLNKENKRKQSFCQKNRLKLQRDKIQNLRNEVKFLSLAKAVGEEPVLCRFEKAGKQFPSDVRLMVYSCITCNVSTENVPLLIKSLANDFDVNMHDVPHRSTVEKMVKEMGVIASYQVAEFVMKNSNLTLGFDATTQEEVHVNEIHVTSKESCMIIALDHLAGGTAEDYETHIAEAIDNLAEIYSLYENCDYQDCRNKMINSFANTMTDRAAVNHAAVRRLEATWNVQFNELNCHLHPLETIASACKSALKAAENGAKTIDPEKFKFQLSGCDAAAANLIWVVNKLRYKNSSGDPKGFTSALRNACLPKGLLPRYRGNRLHILFHISGILLQHFEFFLTFFRCGSTKCDGKFLKKVVSDFTSEVTRVELQVLGLIGKYLTGPWMTKFYTATENSVPHVEGIRIVKTLVNRLKSTSTEDMLKAKEDFFGNPFSNDTDQQLSILQDIPVNQQLFDTMMEKCLAAVVSVLEKQYSRYFSTEIDDILKKETESARCHNIDAEQMMGMFSAAKEKAPNATVSFISSKIRSQKNKVTQYLSELAFEKKETLINFAIGQARKQAKAQRRKMEAVKKEISRRLGEKQQKKRTAERNRIEKIFKTAEDWKSAIDQEELECASKQDIEKILNEKIIGKKFCHVWFDDATQAKVSYFGKIEKVSKRKRGTYVVAYWQEGEEYENAEDYDVTKYELAADFVCGDLIFA